MTCPRTIRYRAYVLEWIKRNPHVVKAQHKAALAKIKWTGPHPWSSALDEHYDSDHEHHSSNHDIKERSITKSIRFGSTSAEQKFFFTFFLENTSLHNVDNLVEFPLYTWFMLLSCAVARASPHHIPHLHLALCPYPTSTPLSLRTVGWG